MRSISHSEITSLLDCPAAHDMGYVGQLANSALRPRTTPVLLREGKAWGAAVAAWHKTDDVNAGRSALVAALDEDAIEQRAQGVFLPDEHERLHGRLIAMLHHHTRTTGRMSLDQLERELDVPIPSRTGPRRSPAYRLRCFLDGVHVDDDGRTWIVEFKLRKRLSSLEQIVLSRQTRWYAWAWRESTGADVAGVIVDERLNELPRPVKLNQDGRPSRQQNCELDAYTAAWAELGGGPDADVVETLAGKRWQHRHQIVFRPGEMVDAERQLVTATKLVAGYDSGDLYPIRNPSPMRCPRCKFLPICATPDDADLVDALFIRTPAKRDRNDPTIALEAA